MLSYFIVKVFGLEPMSFDHVNIFEDFLGQFEPITLMMIIFTTVFLINDEKNGFIKNMISVQNRRSDIFVSRALFILICLTAAALFSLIFYSVSYKIFFKDIAQFRITADLTARSGMMMLVSYAIIIMTAMLGVISKGNVLPLTLGILYLLNFFFLAVSFLNVIVRKITGIEAFDAGCILLPQYFDDSYGTTLQRLLVPLVYIVVSSVIAMLFLEKKDIR